MSSEVSTNRPGLLGKFFGAKEGAPVYAMAIALLALTGAAVISAIKGSFEAVGVLGGPISAIIGYFAGRSSK